MGWEKPCHKQGWHFASVVRQKESFWCNRSSITVIFICPLRLPKDIRPNSSLLWTDSVENANQGQAFHSPITASANVLSDLYPKDGTSQEWVSHILSEKMFLWKHKEILLKRTMDYVFDCVFVTLLLESPFLCKKIPGPGLNLKISIWASCLSQGLSWKHSVLNLGIATASTGMQRSDLRVYAQNLCHIQNFHHQALEHLTTFVPTYPSMDGGFLHGCWHSLWVCIQVTGKKLS